MDQNPPETTPKELSLFPTSAESVDKVLEEIRANPLEQLKTELSSLEVEDPVSSEFLGGLEISLS